MSDTENYGFDTLQIHAGARPDPATGARQTPIYQSTAYVFRDADHAAALFNLQEVGYIYSRLTNPTVAVLQERIATLEGGVGAVCCSSGHAAQIMALFPLMQPGCNVVASTRLYGGTVTQFSQTIKRFGWSAKFVDFDDEAAVKAAIDENTRAVFGEAIANPGGYIMDVRAIADIADAAGLPLIIDNTVATPYLIRPFEHGADIIVHSATKFIGGHGNSIGGLIVDGGSFDFGASGKHPMLTEPDPSYHGLPYWSALGPGSYIIKARVQLLRDLGSAVSPMNAFLFLQGLETLSLRMERHFSNAQKVAEYLDAHPLVEKVSYAGLPSSQWYDRATELGGGIGYGSIVAFDIVGGLDAGVKFVNNLELHSHVANIGDAKSLVIHPASTTHSQLTEEEQAASGVRAGLVRLSVGLESIDDIIADLDKGFAAAG